MQNGFRLIVSVVCQKDPVGGMIGQQFMAHTPGRRFNTFTTIKRYVDATYRQQESQFPTKVSARSSPTVGIGAQSVIHVERRQFQLHAFCQGMDGMQQHRGIEPPGKADHDGLPRAGVAEQTGGDRPQDGISGLLVP